MQVLVKGQIRMLHFTVAFMNDALMLLLPWHEMRSQELQLLCSPIFFCFCDIRKLNVKK